MKNVAVLEEYKYPDIRIVDSDLQDENPNFAFFLARKNWTVEDWKKHLRTQKFNWKVLPKAILNCDAYWELSNPAKVILLRALAELKFKKISKSNSKRSKSLFGGLDGPNIFYLPYGMLMATGIGSKPTISTALKELKISGWIVQVNQRSPFGLSAYRLGPDVLNEKIFSRRPKVSSK